MTRMTPRSHQNPPNEPVIENRKARHAYSIGETLECGIQLRGTEIKSIRASQISLAEGWVRVQEQPLSLSLHGVHIAEYPPAGAKRQHEPIRTRNLLAHKREIKKLADQLRAKSATLGKAKLLVGVGLGKRKADKREDLAKRDAKRDMDRAMSRRRL
jgi:SsrA-binding protein